MMIECGEHSQKAGLPSPANGQLASNGVSYTTGLRRAAQPPLRWHPGTTSTAGVSWQWLQLLQLPTIAWAPKSAVW